MHVYVYNRKYPTTQYSNMISSENSGSVTNNVRIFCRVQEDINGDMNMYVCMHACMCACACTYIYIYVYMYIYICIYIYMYGCVGESSSQVSCE